LLQTNLISRQKRQTEGKHYLHNITRRIGLDVVDRIAHGSWRPNARHDAAGGRRDPR